jgi:hypothetical protein
MKKLSLLILITLSGCGGEQPQARSILVKTGAITLTAERHYSPDSWVYGDTDFNGTVAVPDRLSVVSGNPGDKEAEILFDYDYSGFICTYRGNNVDAYVFESCTNGSLAGSLIKVLHKIETTVVGAVGNTVVSISIDVY